jgi:hypothetical protein
MTKATQSPPQPPGRCYASPVAPACRPKGGKVGMLARPTFGSAASPYIPGEDAPFGENFRTSDHPSTTLPCFPAPLGFQPTNPAVFLNALKKSQKVTNSHK